MSIENWFSVPIYVKDVDIDTQNKIYEEVSNTFDKLNQKDLSNPWGDDVSTTFKYGTSTNDIYRYKWSTLQSKVFESAAEFCREYKIEPPSIIKESWINFYTKNQYQSSHIHPNCILSGVYYLSTSSEDGNIVFENPNPYSLLRISPFIMPSVEFKPIVGRMILFPAWLMHKVKRNETDNTRISITFNF